MSCKSLIEAFSILSGTSESHY